MQGDEARAAGYLMLDTNNNMIMCAVHTCVNRGTRAFEVKKVRYTIGQHCLARSRGLVQLGSIEVGGHDICIVAAGRAHEDSGVAPDQLLEGNPSCSDESQRLKMGT